jgi:hypothetical protein
MYIAIAMVNKVPPAMVLRSKCPLPLPLLLTVLLLALLTLLLLQIRRAPRDMQVLVSAKNSSAVGDKFTVAFVLYPINMRTVTNATFTGIIPPTLSVISLAKSLTPGGKARPEAVCTAGW